MTKLGRGLLVLVAGLLSGLALTASAAGTTAAHGGKKVRHLQLPVAALAVDGDRVAYGLSSRYATKPHTTGVLVWNLRTGKTVKVSGKKTAHADDSSTGAGVFQLAIAGSRVAWLVNVGGNTEGDDYLFTSSVTKPRERKVATASRFGDNCPGRQTTNCAGPWLGGLVHSGSLIELNRWTTDSTGAVTGGELDVLSGTKLKQVATGANTVQAADAGGGRIAVLHSDGTVALYSSAGKPLLTVSPPSAEAVALSGSNLVVLTKTRTLELYNARTGAHRKTLPVHRRKRRPAGNLDVQGNIAIYTTGTAVHAVNLSTGKDRVVGQLRSSIAVACVGSSGLVYAGNGYGKTFGKGTLVFVPMARVTAAVR
jgi:hypothetical protein